MPGFSVRVRRSDGLIIYDSGGAVARVNAVVIDKPSPGYYTYTLEVKALEENAAGYYTYNNGIGIIESKR